MIVERKNIITLSGFCRCVGTGLPDMPPKVIRLSVILYQTRLPRILVL